jgi:inner membrane protein
MDIITHTLSGVAVSTVVASISKKKIWEKGLILLCGGVGGILPDIDAMSLWSRFDHTIGKFFQLSHKGPDIYFSNYWYSHHNFTHSLMGGLIITFCFFSLFFFPVMLFSKEKYSKNVFKYGGVYWIAMFFGYVMHLLGDLPTPACTWGGIKLLWPLTEPVGGTGQIWWWNNYDIFLITLGCCAINIGLIVFYHLMKKTYIKYTPVFICIVSFIAILHQIDQRNVSFAYSGYTKRWDEYEKKSLGIQKKILGEKMYNIMRRIDRKLTVPF